MVEDLLVGFSLAVFEVCGGGVAVVGGEGVAGFEVREVALDVAACAGAAGGGEADVGGHGLRVED